MNDLISRQAAIKILHEALDAADQIADVPFGVYQNCRDKMNELPPAQSETAKRIIGKSKDGMTLWYQCDMCNEPVDAQDNFCRECGRRLIDE